MSIVSAYLNLFPVTLFQGLVFGLVALGIAIPFRFLAFPDLTAEGAFPLGGSVAAAAIAGGIDPFVATLLAIAAGALAGLATATIHLTLRLNTLLCGILVLTMLFSIDIRIMGKPNIALFAFGDLFGSLLGETGGSLPARTGLVALVALAAAAALLWFLRTEIGMALRAVGASQSMARAQGLSVARYTLVGLAIAGGAVAAAGALTAQNQSFADVNMGVGVLVNGLASLIVGEQLVGRTTLARQIAAAPVGAIVYFQLVSLALSVGLQPSDLKLFTGLLVLLLLAGPRLLGKTRPAL